MKELNMPDVKDYIRKDPSKLTNEEILLGYKKYCKALEKHCFTLENYIIHLILTKNT